MPDAEAKCIVCGAHHFTFEDRKDAKADGQTVKIALCENCGHVQIANVPDPESLRRFYSEEYRLSFRSARHPKPKHVLRAGRRATQRLKRLRGFLREGDRLLDIGSGGGEFVYLATRRGIKASGIDPASDYLSFARDAYGIDVQDTEIAALEPDRSFDVVTMFHVLEHLPDPAATFRTAFDLLADEGKFVVEVPNLDATDTSPTNHFFKAHISYFTKTSLKRLAAAGFDVEVMEADKVLFAVFAKRNEWRDDLEPAAFDLPDGGAVAASKLAMKNRNFWRYIASGGPVNGLKKLARVVEEPASAYGAGPKELLDRF
ncbi:MAG: class I SAM-dependent methyltransferase [Pseudomonadota bacterium]